MSAPLTAATYQRALRQLTRRDPDLHQIVQRFGPPPMWSRRPGFPTLLHIILEQQVSLASARAAFLRLKQTISPLTPARFLELDDVTLKRIGFSRQKTAYGRHLAEAITRRDFRPSALLTMDDAAVRAELIKLKGIGQWTADVYLLMALGRPDVWPVGDLALVVAAQQVKRLPTRPTPAEMETLGEQWRPYRAIAARVLWQYYLGQKR